MNSSWWASLIVGRLQSKGGSVSSLIRVSAAMELAFAFILFAIILHHPSSTLPVGAAIRERRRPRSNNTRSFVPH
jgi:hypothetical protein